MNDPQNLVWFVIVAHLPLNPRHTRVRWPVSKCVLDPLQEFRSFRVKRDLGANMLAANDRSAIMVEVVFCHQRGPLGGDNFD